MKLIIHEQQLLIIFALLACLVVLVMWRVLKRWSVSKNNSFDVIDLFMENGRASRKAIWAHGAFAATTWLIVFLTLSAKITEGYFAIYVGAWVTPIVAGILKSDNPQADPVKT